jgi:hypothetical protein
MEVQIKPEIKAKFDELSAETGLTADELIEDALAGYLEEIVKVRQMLNRRYDDFKSGKVKPVDGERFFEELGRREEELLQQRLKK